MARFNIRMDPAWRLALMPFGATKNRSFVDVTDDAVHFQFGFMFSRTVPRDEIEGAHRRVWPLWMGIGWRSNLRGLIGLIGSFEGVVEVQLRSRGRAWGIFPCDRIAVSVEDPDVFVAALQSRKSAPSSTPATPSAENGTRLTPTRPIAAPKTRTIAEKPAPGGRTSTPRRSTRAKKAPAVKKPVAKRGTTRKRRGDT